MNGSRAGSLLTKHNLYRLTKSAQAPDLGATQYR
jgi:hypothetical protein